MKRILWIIMLVLLVSGCEAGSDLMGDRSVKINEELLSNCGNEDGFSTPGVSIETETRTFEDGTYQISYLNSKGEAVKIEAYDGKDDTLISTTTFYSKKNCEKVVTEYNSEYAERQFADYPSSVPHIYTVMEIWYYGESVSSLKNPSLCSGPRLEEWHNSIGEWGISRYLLDSNYEQYFDSSEAYDADGNLVFASHGDPQHGEEILTMEYYTYENGEMIQKVECDLVNGSAVCTDYVNGEVASTETWTIDQYGNRIE